MKFIFNLSVLLAVVVLGSCDNDNNIENTSVVGVWQDINEYESSRIVNGTEVTTIHSNIRYEMMEDGTYSVNDDFIGGIHQDGTWQLNEETNKLLFFLESNDFDSLFVFSHFYEWEILDLNANTLEVNYYFRQDSINGAPFVESTTHRIFERQE